MSEIEFAEHARLKLPSIAVKMLEEITEALDTRVPLPRRIAIVVKWSWFLHGLGYKKPLSRMDLTPEDVVEAAFDMLKWMAGFIKRNIL